MIRIISLLLCLAAAWGQELVSRVVKLQHIRPESTTALLDTFSNNKVRWRVDNSLRIVALSGPQELVDAMEAAVKKLDVPPPPPPPAPVARNIELAFHMLLAAPSGESPGVPQDLAPVVQQLRNVFGLKSVRVLETAIVRARESRPGETNGIMPPTAKVDATAQYSLRFDGVYIAGAESTPRIKVDRLRFSARLPFMNSGGGINYNEALISTDIDMKEGQKVVVGKSSVDAASQSIFLVVTGKIVD